jgi:hypothetical protein
MVVSSLSLDKTGAKEKYVLLPPKIVDSDPLVKVCVDLFGLFTIKAPIKTTKTNSLLALTMYD